MYLDVMKNRNAYILELISVILLGISKPGKLGTELVELVRWTRLASLTTCLYRCAVLAENNSGLRGLYKDLISLAIIGGAFLLSILLGVWVYKKTVIPERRKAAKAERHRQVSMSRARRGSQASQT